MNEPQPSATSVPVAPTRGRFSFLKKMLLIFAVIFMAMIVIVMLQPNDFRVERSAKINAEPAAVFAQVNDFHNWEKWSPWAKLDPAMKVAYDGPASGKGAVYSWVGNDEVGEGRMEILESKPNELIRIKLDFIKPFAASNDTVFTFKPDGTQTNATWTMNGKNNFMMKAFHLVMNIDKMVGAQFDEGFTKLKAVVEPKQ